GKCESRSAGIRTVENGVIRLNEARTPSTVAVDQMRAIGSTTSHDCEPMKVVVRKINRRGEHVDYPACSGCRGAVTREFKVIHLHVTRPDEPGVAVIVIGATRHEVSIKRVIEIHHRAHPGCPGKPALIHADVN